MKKQRKGFTLTELSIVLVIMGLLIVGTMRGLSMVRASSAASARSFTAKSPVLQLSGLVAWYETSTQNSLKSGESADGLQTSEWYDISPSSIAGKKNKLTKSAGSDVVYELDGINKFATLQFNGSGKISIANFYQSTLAQATVFLVFHPMFTPSGTQVTLFDSYSAGSTTSIGIKNNAVSLNSGSAVDTGTGTNAASFANGKDYVVAAYLNGSSSGAYVNNATTLAGAANISAGTNVITGVTIGTNKGGTAGFTGFISEVIIFNRPLKLQERKDVMRYLARKYNVAVTGI